MNTYGQGEKDGFLLLAGCPVNVKKRQMVAWVHTRKLTLLYMIELRRMLQYPQTSESSFREQVPLSNFPTSKHQGDLLLQIFT